MTYDELMKLDKEELVRLLLNEKKTWPDPDEILDNIKAAVVVTDKNGTIEYTNHWYGMVTGYSREEVAGKNPRIMQSGMQSKEFYSDMWETILSGKSWFGEFHNRKKSGEIFWALAAISAVRDNSGEILHFIEILQDITAMKNFQEKLESLNETKDKVMSIISHDLHSPVSSLFALINIIRDDIYKREPDELMPLFDEVESSVDAVAALIERVISWAKTQQGNLLFQPESFLFREIVENSFAALHVPADRKNVSLKYSGTGDVTAFADKFMAETILRNLLNNAIKFSFEGGEVIVDARRDYAGFVFSVRDFGAGMDPEQAKALFGPAVKIVPDSKSGTAREKGHGIGIYICRDFIDRHKGTIEAESERGAGTVITCTFPGPPQSSSKSTA